MDLVDLTADWLAWLFWPGVMLGTVLALVAIARFLQVPLKSTALVVAMASFPVYMVGGMFDDSLIGSDIMLTLMVVSWITAIVAAFRARRGSPERRPPNIP